MDKVLQPYCKNRGGVTSCNPCHATVLEGNSKRLLCHPEFISGSKDPIFKMLKRVQHDENWTKTVCHPERSLRHAEFIWLLFPNFCHSEFISESKKFVKNAWFSTESKNIIKQTLKQVQGDVNSIQNDKNLAKIVCHAEFISASKNTICDVRSLGGV